MSRVGVNISTGDIHFSLGVYGVVACGSDIYLSSGYRKGSFDFHSLAFRDACYDCSAAYLHIPRIDVLVVWLFLIADFNGLAGDASGLASSRGDGECASGDVTVGESVVGLIEAVNSGPYTLSAGSGVLDGHLAASHPEKVVGLYSGSPVVLVVFAVEFHSSAHIYGCLATLDQHIVISCDAFFHRRRGGNVQGAVGDLDIVLAPDTVPCGTAGSNFH